MHTFIREIRERHRAQVVPLFRRHRAGLGYAILLVGMLIALGGVVHALQRLEAQGHELRSQNHTLKGQNTTLKGQNAELARQHTEIKGALREARHEAALTRGVICKNATRQDQQTLAYLKTKTDRELVRALGLTPTQLRHLIHRQLAASAEQRKSLQPSDPPSACSGRLTTLRPPVRPRPPD